MQLTEENDFQMVAFVTSLATILSVIGYLHIFKAIWKNPSLRCSSPWLLLLGVSDLMFSMHTAMVAVACFNRQWPFGEFGCLVHSYLAFPPLASTVSIAALLWERVKSEKIMDMIPFKSGWTTVTGVWLLINVGVVTFLCVAEPIQLKHNTMACFMNLEHRNFYSKNIFSLLIFGFAILPFISMVYSCYLLRRVTKKVILIPVIFFLTYVPFNLCTQTTVFGTFCLHALWIKLCPKFGSSLNSYVQIYANPELMEACIGSQAGKRKKQH